ncbi:hypothetical protein [Micromonospora saelicesensis]|uniref:hypothetical protein n=1 Tax=Micromonospora saelicesensis TaxID=285676 RepID=UPI0011BE2997|nr:hypothetical protein [Micromonospora saelicesensis]
MTAADANPPPAADDEVELEDLADPLATWARATALGLGTAAGVLGCYAVFASDNQAGTAFLLVASVVLLLLGLQGTPLRSLGGGDYQIQLARIRLRAVQAIDNARRESPELAAAVADAVGSIDPGVSISRPPWMLYLQAVRQAISRTLGSVDQAHEDGLDDRGVDTCVQLPNGRVNVQIKYRGRGALGLRDIAMATAQMRGSGFDGGYLLVTNAPLSEEARHHNFETPAELGRVEVITWNDERDDDLLSRALARNAR